MAAPTAASAMQYRHLGRTGLKVSVLSYGAWVSFGNQIDVQGAKGLLAKCREFGVNFFDNAEVYANGKAEEIMGQAIKELGWKRSDVVISTKIFWGGQVPNDFSISREHIFGPNDVGLSRKHIIEGTQACLRRLQMEYVDVLFCHRPDTSTPIEETVRAMNYVINKGWAFYWGTSEWNAQQITEAWAVATRLGLIGPAVEQPQYNLLARDRVEVEYAPLYKNHGLGLTIWSPLGSGVLTGKYSRDSPPPPDSRFALENYKNLASRKLVEDILSKVDALKPIAQELDVTLAQLAIAWCVSNPNVSTVITGATKEQQVLHFLCELQPERIFNPGRGSRRRRDNFFPLFEASESSEVTDHLQVTENMEALKAVSKLTPELMEKIEAIVQSKPKKLETFR